MKTKIFTVYDSKAEAYMSPFYMQSTGAAIRAFSDTAADPSSQIAKHPSDYTLFEIGEFDDATAEISLLTAKKSLGVAVEFINQTKE